MDDRKRPAAADQDDSAPPSKRQAVQVNGSRSQPDAEYNAALELYQKDAILRQMREYKREKVHLEERLAKLEERTAHHDDHIRIMDTWFDQGLDEMIALAEQMLGPPKEHDGSPFPSALLFADVEKFQEHLSGRTEKIRSTLTSIYSRLPPSSPEVRKLQEQINSLLAKQKANRVEIDRLNITNDELTERLEDASLRYMVAEKKLDRHKSTVVAKMEKGVSLGGDDAPSAETSTDSNGVKGIKQETASAELVSARQEALAEAAKCKDQLEQLEAENKKLTAELTVLQTKLAGLSDDDYAKTELFKAFKAQYEDVVKRLNHLEATNTQLREEAQKLQAERTAYRRQLDNESQTAIRDLETQLAKAESDVARIRTTRDECMSEVAVMKASQAQQQTSVNQIRELASARESRVDALETEVERLRRKVGDLQLETRMDEDLALFSPEELRSRLASLQQEFALVNKQLPSMEAAWSKAQALAVKKANDTLGLEEQISRLMAEKAKADQKYFGAMKLKEAKDSENRVLRNQNQKSGEIVTQLKEALSSSQTLSTNLEKQLSEAKDALNTLSARYRSLEQKIAEQNLRSESLAKKNVELEKLLASKDTETSEARHMKREAELEVERLNARLEERERSLKVWEKKGLANQSDIERQLRHMCYCSVCRSNIKDMIIKGCGHSFCKACIKDRLDVRSRKCPACNVSFGNSDCIPFILDY